jgi:phosphatidylserine/phosphatidylglycerophosphate/cardiolipin synthase-like enzyme
MQQAPTVIIGKQYVEKVSPLIAAAAQSIDIIMYHWQMRPSLQQDPVSLLMQLLQAAQARGVRVRCVVGSAKQCHQLSGYKLENRQHFGDKLVHAKMLLIDNRIAVVGSHNLTKMGLTKNLEISLAVTFDNPQNELVAYFQNLWGV